jgi:hypothetical protein
MKNPLSLLLVILCLSASCKKEKVVVKIQFNTMFAKTSDSIAYKTVDALLIHYDEFKDISKIDDSTSFSHSVTLKIDKSRTTYQSLVSEYISLEAGRYVIKKFDLIDSSGKIVYYIPYTIPEKYEGNINGAIIPLPYTQTIYEGLSNVSFTIIKK